MHGFQQWQDRPGHQACPLQMIRGIQTCSAADIARELDIDWVVHRIVRDQLFTEKCVHTGYQRISQMMTKFTVWTFLVFIGHVTLIKESSFGAETWLIMQNLILEKGCVIEKLSSPSSKEHGALSSVNWKTVWRP